MSPSVFFAALFTFIRTHTDIIIQSKAKTCLLCTHSFFPFEVYMVYVYTMVVTRDVYMGASLYTLMHAATVHKTGSGAAEAKL